MPNKKVTFTISAAAAPFVGDDKPRSERLKAARGQVPLSPDDLVVLVFYLCHDGDPEVKATAIASMRAMPARFLVQVLANKGLHPRILDALVQLHFNKPEVAPLLKAHPMLSERSAAFLAREAAVATSAATQPAASQAASPAVQPTASSETPAGKDAAKEPELPGEGNKENEAPSEEEEPDETTEEFQSKYQLSQNMGVADKIKMALTGDKEWRSILIKDSNKLVSGAVVKNPRITEAEVLAIAKSQVQNDEIMRVICANKDWIKNYPLRKALIENHKTPLPAALRFISSLTEKDLSGLARSKNVSTVIATQARRILMGKKEGR
ncbi:hypothetical protein L4X63_16590 [Geomonas sp. Red32]|uniref:hypothetical protein n=1 Tax=Geomonas sp. Red32 TaxID=2912856 RepID=UPI00202CBDC7|nr:hypothetical protein [Geomonas sp. Red32]